MRYKKLSLLLCLALIFYYNGIAQVVKNISLKDFDLLIGSWQGNLTYLDYSSGKPYTMPANVDIRNSGKTNKFIFSNIYPKEPNANSVDTLTISKDGNKINDDSVKSIRKLGNGNVEIITELQGKDGNDNKPALIRHTYIFGNTVFVIRKDVQFTGQTEWIKRNEYSYTKSL